MRRGERQEAAIEAAKAITFRNCAEAFIEAHKAGWRNDKHAAQWTATLATYAFPVFGDLPVQVVDTGLVMKALEAIWTTTPETATRVRGRIESVLDWVATRDYRRGENPARWKGHLQNLLPRRSKVRKVEHHAALPFKDVPAFMKAVAARPGFAAKLMAFTIPTAARMGEVLGARWDEIDMEAGIWTVPSERMKAGTEQRVPLSPAAMAMLAEMQGLDETFVFPGGRREETLSDMAMLAQAIKRTELSRLPVTGLDHLEIITQLVEFPPGSMSPRHFHRGKGTFYVLEGGTVQEPGRPPRERAPGEHGIIRRGAHHSGYTVVGDRTIKVLSVYVVDKGKPLQKLV